MNKLAFLVTSIIAGGVFLSTVDSASAQLDRSRCASCHFANPYTEPAGRHLDDWDRSPHGRSDVGCESCHDGNADTFESFLAHRDIVPSSDESSPAHRTNLPRTCGTCHAGPYTNFQASRHFALLNDGDQRGPTCTTCHDSVRGDLLSPSRFENRCESCHGADGVAPRPGRAAEARVLLQGIADVRESLEAARRLIDRVDDVGRRAELDETYIQAEVPLIQAAQAGHRFVFDQLEERLGTARQRTADLLSMLVNPSP